jgi:hypothetical protein
MGILARLDPRGLLGLLDRLGRTVKQDQKENRAKKDLMQIKVRPAHQDQKANAESEASTASR